MRLTLVVTVLLVALFAACGGTAPSSERAPVRRATPAAESATAASAPVVTATVPAVTAPVATMPAVTATVPAVTATAPAGASTGAARSPVEESCTGARVTFDHAPVDLEAIEYVLPLGLMIDSHVTPVDHQYFQNSKQPDLDIDVYSPAAGTVTDIQRMTQILADGPREEIDDFRLVIEHSCTISSIFIHVGELSPALAAVAPPPGGFARVSVAVTAGERIGTFRRNVDYSVIDQDVTLDGLLVAEHYSWEPWKVHTPDPFDYFSDDVRERLVAKSVRTAEPVAGRLDYDIDGRLVGNWFREGTNGYRGVDRERYWAGHLALAYDFLDPSHVVVSIGTYDGASAQFGVRGNGPDPAEVSAASGVVRYELVPYEYWSGGERWDRISLVRGVEAKNVDGQVRGVALFQLLDGRRLKVEVFPGRTASEVDGFTAAALIYER